MIGSRSLLASLILASFILPATAHPVIAQEIDTAIVSNQAHTAVVLPEPVPLSEAAAILANLELPVIELQHIGGGWGGAFYNAPTSPEAALVRYSNELRRSKTSAHIYGFRLAGVLTQNPPAGSVVSRVPRNAITALSPLGTTNDPIRIIRPVRQRDEHLPDQSTNAPDARLWTPAVGRTTAYTTNSVTNPRQITHLLSWSSRDSLDAFGEDAYEHDFKLFNESNPASILCDQAEAARFWARRSDGRPGDSSDIVITNFPVESLPYYDTDASDDCRYKDFTVGLFEPTRLQAAVELLDHCGRACGIRTDKPLSATSGEAR